MRFVITIAALFLLVSPAVAGAILDQPVADLGAAIQARIAAIGPIPANKAEKKEAKKLDRALDALAGYTGVNDKSGLRSIGQAIKQIIKSKTTDAGITQALVTLLEAFATLAEEVGQNAQDVTDDLTTQKFITKMDKALDKLDRLIQLGRSLIATNPKKAAKKLIDAVLDALKALEKAEGYLQREGGGVTPPVNNLTMDANGVIKNEGNVLVLLEFVRWTIVVSVFIPARNANESDFDGDIMMTDIITLNEVLNPGETYDCWELCRTTSLDPIGNPPPGSAVGPGTYSKVTGDIIAIHSLGTTNYTVNR